MSRQARVLLISTASIVVAALASACGTQKISVPSSDPAHAGALLFAQRCSGCHTLSYASTHGSAANPRSALFNNGPDFDVRCERPVTRVLYAIENGGFAGGIMPQNIVVGQDAVNVAEFVAKYAGRQAPKVIGAVTCDSKSIGTIPPPASTTTSTSTTSTSSTPAAGATTAASSPSTPRPRQHPSAKKK